MQINTSARAGDEHAQKSQTTETPERYWQRSRAILGSSLPPMQRLVLLAVSDHIGKRPDCWPSLDRLADRTGAGRSTVLRALAQLEAAGVLAVTRKPGRANRYRVSWGQIQKDATDQCHSDTATDQCHSDTRVRTTPVSDRHPTSATLTPHQCHSDTRSGSGTDQRSGSIIPPTPQGVSDVSPQTVDKSADQSADLKALWSRLEDIRAEHNKGSRRRSLTAARRKELSARVREHSVDEVEQVCRWIWTSDHHRARFIRENGHEGAMLRASKFADYLDLSNAEQATRAVKRQPWEEPARPPAPILIDCADAARAFLRTSGELRRVKAAGAGRAEVARFLSWRVTAPDLVLSAMGVA